MERQPQALQDTDARINELLGRATERHRENPIFADSQGFQSIAELIDSRLHSWDFSNSGFTSERFTERRHLEQNEPNEVLDTRELLGLPDDELSKYGAKIDLLRGHLAYYDGDKEEALWHLDHAQSGFLEQGNLSFFATASAKLARVAREAGFIELAEQAHRNAIQSYQQIQDLHNQQLITDGLLQPADATVYNMHSFDEYRRLAKTLGTPSAVKEHGAGKLKALRREIKSLAPVAKSEAVFGVLALMQVEYEWSKHGGYRHYKLAQHYGFICSAARLGGASLGMIDIFGNRKKELPTVNSVAGWADVLARRAPDMLAGGIDYFSDVDSKHW